jgi:hypothetical protein
MKRASIGAISLAGSIVRLACEKFRIGNEIAVKRRRQLNCEPNRLAVLNWAELELRHSLPPQPA